MVTAHHVRVTAHRVRGTAHRVRGTAHRVRGTAHRVRVTDSQQRSRTLNFYIKFFIEPTMDELARVLKALRDKPATLQAAVDLLEREAP